MSQTALFAPSPALSDASGSPRWERVSAQAEVYLARGVLESEAATGLLDRLIAAIPWRQDAVRMFGKAHPIPRLHQWYGDPGRVYAWSGIELEPLAWTPALAEVRDRVERVTRRQFNAVLINYYRDGGDSMGWHADDEPELGPAPVIASLSLGAARDFVLRRTDDNRVKLSISLTHGSLLVMAGDTQARWQHALPRRKRVAQPRVNLTFRAITRR